MCVYVYVCGIFSLSLSLCVCVCVSRLDDLREWTEKRGIPVYIRSQDKQIISSAFPYLFDTSKVESLSLSLSHTCTMFTF